MWVSCNTCHRSYDDAAQWTICPHSLLGMPVDDLCPQCDTSRSIHGACRHQTGIDSSRMAAPPIQFASPEDAAACQRDFERLGVYFVRNGERVDPTRVRVLSRSDKMFADMGLTTAANAEPSAVFTNLG